MMSPTLKTILVKYEFIGYHKWVNAPKPVAFLKNEHRHMFHVEVEFPVSHNDRDLEFYLMRDELKKAIDELYEAHPDFLKGKMVQSCEQVGEDLGEILVKKGFEWRKIQVTEDGDNGSVIRNPYAQ